MINTNTREIIVNTQGPKDSFQLDSLLKNKTTTESHQVSNGPTFRSVDGVTLSSGVTIASSFLGLQLITASLLAVGTGYFATSRIIGATTLHKGFKALSSILRDLEKDYENKYKAVKPEHRPEKEITIMTDLISKLTPGSRLRERLKFIQEFFDNPTDDARDKKHIQFKVPSTAIAAGVKLELKADPFPYTIPDVVGVEVKQPSVEEQKSRAWGTRVFKKQGKFLGEELISDIAAFAFTALKMREYMRDKALTKTVLINDGHGKGGTISRSVAFEIDSSERDKLATYAQNYMRKKYGWTIGKLTKICFKTKQENINSIGRSEIRKSIFWLKPFMNKFGAIGLGLTACAFLVANIPTVVGYGLSLAGYSLSAGALGGLTTAVAGLTTAAIMPYVVPCLLAYIAYNAMEGKGIGGLLKNIPKLFSTVKTYPIMSGSIALAVGIATFVPVIPVVGAIFGGGVLAFSKSYLDSISEEKCKEYMDSRYDPDSQLDRFFDNISKSNGRKVVNVALGGLSSIFKK